MRSDYAPKRIYYRKRRDLREKVNQEQNIFLKIYDTDKHTGFEIASSHSTFFYYAIVFFPNCKGTTQHTASEF